MLFCNLNGHSLQLFCHRHRKNYGNITIRSPGRDASVNLPSFEIYLWGCFQLGLLVQIVSIVQEDQFRSAATSMFMAVRIQQVFAFVVILHLCIIQHHITIPVEFDEAFTIKDRYVVDRKYESSITLATDNNIKYNAMCLPTSVPT